MNGVFIIIVIKTLVIDLLLSCKFDFITIIQFLLKLIFKRIFQGYPLFITSFGISILAPLLSFEDRKVFQNEVYVINFKSNLFFQVICFQKGSNTSTKLLILIDKQNILVFQLFVINWVVRNKTFPPFLTNDFLFCLKRLL